VEQQSEIFRFAQDDSLGEDRKADCTRSRLARIVLKQQLKETNNGNKNWIGGMGRHVEAGQGNDETW
jgi:hypothetical protein